MAIFVRPVEPADLPRITDVLRASWGGTTVIALGRGELIDASALPGFVALAGADLAGLVTYTVAGDTVEIVTIDAVLPGQGVGSLLLDAVRRAATAGGAARIVLVTTNDNTGAL
ncbi:MAG: GNAT family N-acetyltransferase, partial [Catenulispora sp.]|nr:GNAT family N-acetyltransferase [Catenulispora sp.]